jgi:hypothetical protein
LRRCWLIGSTILTASSDIALFSLDLFCLCNALLGFDYCPDHRCRLSFGILYLATSAFPQRHERLCFPSLRYLRLRSILRKSSCQHIAIGGFKWRAPCGFGTAWRRFAPLVFRPEISVHRVARQCGKSSFDGDLQEHLQFWSEQHHREQSS